MSWQEACVPGLKCYLCPGRFSQIHTASHSITRPNPAKTSLGRRSGLPLQFCCKKCGLGASHGVARRWFRRPWRRMRSERNVHCEKGRTR